MGFPRESESRGIEIEITSKMEAAVFITSRSLGSDIPSLLLYSVGHTDQHWYVVSGRDHPSVRIPRGRGHCPSQR